MPSHARASAVRLPTSIQACLFDLDGVLTDIARAHAAAWKERFDSYLRSRADRDIDAPDGEPDDPVGVETVRDTGPRGEMTR
ncbi:hypothetical protein [Tsukamurella soli]|uniref:Uncharacterized protein n=1 Tax=Tsukamurella soli TaxID=644556 RepID=A0ABP8K3Z4_9ACTN